MYSVFPHFVLGFHGCDQSVAERVLAGTDHHLSSSANGYDWLGHRIYFWEHNPQRALEYAHELKENPKRTSKGKTVIENPVVVGAIIDHGTCLNLLEGKSIDIVRASYDHLSTTTLSLNKELPQNNSGRRYLDCAVIQAPHELMEMQGKAYHSVRGAFIGGEPLYEGAEFKEKNHIQICVCNPNCIKGYFRPMMPVGGIPIPRAIGL
ncbi:MAG: hypothetical protein EG822_17150 [Deltaproteobacteria bacterium]|nr:hypothetical protein [Deltaproteobacteria bacterium]TLN00547.1 MAG: hypothetical protein FDZ73_19105 [bacterium]